MIAILLCAFNGEKRIGAMIDSVLKQTYKDIMLFVSDDGSTDSTESIIDDYVSKFPNKVRRIRIQKLHNGAGLHFLRALQNNEIKCSDYVMLADQDDIWCKNKVEKSVCSIKQLESRTKGDHIPLAVFCDSVLVSDDMEMIAPSYMKYAKLNPKKATFSHLLVQNVVTGAAMIMNKDLVEMINRIPEHFVMHDHWIALVTSAFGKIDYINEPLYMYIRHQKNTLDVKPGGVYNEIILRLRNNKKAYVRKSVREQARKNYEAMLLQAQSFEDIYGGRIRKDYARILKAYIDIPNKGMIGRVITILKYHITCDNWYRVIGQCSFFARSRILE